MLAGRLRPGRTGLPSVGPMVVLLVVVGIVAVVGIALASVGIVVKRLGPEPARQVFEGDEALTFVAAAMPDEVTAQLSYEDVRRILRLHLDFLHRQGVARSGGDLPEGDGPLVVEFGDGVDEVLARAAAARFHPQRDQVAAVISAQMAYFEAIGALAEVEGPDLSAGPSGLPLGGPEPANPAGPAAAYTDAAGPADGAA